MSKNVALFVDVANLYYSARGQDVDVDYVALLKTATKGRDLIRAYAYSGLDPENENQRKFIDFLKKNGYMVLTKDIRKFGDGRVKANLDIELVVDLFRLADRMDIAVIVSGDGDFAPAIKALQDKGVRCEVISFRPNTSSDLIAVADEFIDIMKIAGIGRGSSEAKAQRGMSAPEMPAKEVVPEFGFREASPSVAQAALAALREGRGDGARSSGTARGRGRGRSAEKPAAAAEPEAAPAAIAEDGEGHDGEQRKRRRRRGGRGRGRGRGRSGETAAAVEPGGAGEAGQIGWVELDDLSQLAELEGVEDLGSEREYSFEEADEATLAELGLTIDAAAAPESKDAGGAEALATGTKRTARRGATKSQVKPEAAAGEPAEPAGGAGEDPGTAQAPPKKPARRRRATAKSGAESEAAPVVSSDDATAETPKRSRSASGRSSTAPRARARTKKADADASKPEAEAPPRRRTSTSRKAAPASAPDQDSAEPAAESAEETEGIWQRFRSARGTTRSS